MGAASSGSNSALFCDAGRIGAFPCEYSHDMSDRNVIRRRLTDSCILDDLPLPPKGFFSLDSNGREPSPPRNIGYVCKQGRKPTVPNQDDFCVLKQEDWAIYAVADGHGPTGHRIASNALKSIVQSVAKNSKFPHNLPTCFAEAFNQAQTDCEQDTENCDASNSGASVAIVVVHEHFVEAAHVGDTRGVQAVQRGKAFQAFDLTRDHRCDNPDEKRRLEQCGGVVRPGQGTYPSRLYSFGCEEPGISISRSIGDLLAHTLGVSQNPDIEQTTKDSPGFVILATDGLWTFITSQEAVDIVKMYPNEAQTAADNLYQLAVKRWTDNDPNVDDITVVIAWH
eukprot:GEMP01026467.1.p1 GENE.GEMP01026467.1~~GEMP01026467.1.p1  ORF type:complete len:338 (+),score=48.95 GEMP01026467.1:56-1069(+)